MSHGAQLKARLEGLEVALLTKRKFAKLLGISLRSLDRMISDGAIATVRLSTRTVRISPDELNRLVREKTVQNEAR